MKYETAGDPMTGLLWTRKTREKISDELASIGIYVAKTTVGKILHKMGFSLKCNSKKVSNGGRRLTKGEAEERDQQFKKIERMRERFVKNGLPIISVDTKKKELIGNFKNPGTRYKKEADLANDHDFVTYAIGKVFPYGIYDVQKNEGYVYVGQAPYDKREKKFTSHETAEFASENIVKWWEAYGMRNYPDADEILILSDSGGSNAYRSHMWKFKLCELLSIKHRLKVTVCHYPPGASKWNAIEHRLFSEITKNWQAAPLVNFETVLKFIRTTKTKTGLTVKAHPVTKRYELKQTVPDDMFDEINLEPHNSLPHWNYTISPN